MGGVEWTDLAQDRQIGRSCEHVNGPVGSINCGKFDSQGTVSFSRRILLHGFSYSDNAAPPTTVRLSSVTRRA